MKKTIVFLAASIALAACSGSNGTTISGVFTLEDPDGHTGSWDDCEGDGGYSDFDAGVPVRIQNEDGKRIGATTLRNLTEDDVEFLVELEVDGRQGVGLLDDQEAETLTHEDAVAKGLDVIQQLEGRWCIKIWEAVDVETSEIYSVEVGGRGTIDYTRETLSGDGWFVSSGLG